jgi:DNA-binding SARP family transcriptional activator
MDNGVPLVVRSLPSPTMTEAKLLLLGPPIWADEASLTSLRPREALLLAYLVDHAPRPINRELFASLLWPDADRVRSLRSLSQLQYQLKNKAPGAILHADSNSIAARKVRTDLDVMQWHAEAGRVLDALRLMRGPFLDPYLELCSELEAWRASKNNMAMMLIDQCVTAVISSGLPPHDLQTASELIEQLLMTGVSSRAILLARLVFQLRRGEEDNAQRSYSHMASEHENTPTLAEIQRRFVSRQVEDDDEEDTQVAVPFVGRRRELHKLKEAIDRASKGHGRTIVLHGESGIGKSRLADQALRRAALAGFRTWSVRAHAASQRVPYTTANDLVKLALSSRSHGTLDDKQRGAELLRAVQQAESSGGDRALFDQFADFVEGEAAYGPVAILVDDAQWLDDVTTQFVMFLALRIPRLAVVLILCLRSDEALPPGHMDIRDLPGAMFVPVAHLLVEESSAIVEEYERRYSIMIEAGVRHRILSQTSGRPYLLLEMLHALRTSTSSLENGFIPDGVEVLLKRRFDNLPHRSSWVAGIVAAYGSPMWPGAVQKISNIPHPELAEHLHELLRRGILQAETDEVRFSHDLLREVAYRTLPPITRVLAHGAIAEYLIAEGGESGLIANHLEQANDGDAAATYAASAASSAALAERFSDLEHFCSMTLRLNPDRLHDELVLVLVRHLARAQRPHQIAQFVPQIRNKARLEEAEFLYDVATLRHRMEVGSQSPDDLVEAAEKLNAYLYRADPVDILPVIGPLMDVVLDAADVSTGNRIVRSLLEVAVRSGDTKLARQAHCMGLLWHCVTEGFDEALRSAAGGLSTHVQEDGTGLVAFAQGTILMLCGELVAARNALEMSFEQSARSGDMARQLAASANLAVLLLEQSDFDGAERHLSLTQTSPNVAHRLRCLANLATLQFERGLFNSSLDSGLDLLSWNQAYAALKYTHTAHAIVGLSLLALGRSEEARSSFDALAPAIQANSLHGDIPYIVSFAAAFMGQNKSYQPALDLIDVYKQKLSSKDAIGFLRLEVARAELLTKADPEAGYRAAKNSYSQSIALGADTLARRTRRLMLRARA